MTCPIFEPGLFSVHTNDFYVCSIVTLQKSCCKLRLSTHGHLHGLRHYACFNIDSTDRRKSTVYWSLHSPVHRHSIVTNKQAGFVTVYSHKQSKTRSLINFLSFVVYMIMCFLVVFMTLCCNIFNMYCTAAIVQCSRCCVHYCLFSVVFVSWDRCHLYSSS